MKSAFTLLVLAASLVFMAVPADAQADAVGVATAPARTGLPTGGFAPDPPPPPLPADCQPDSTDPTCHPAPPPAHHHHGFL